MTLLHISTLARPHSLSIVAAARRAPRRTTPAVGADLPMAASPGRRSRGEWRAELRGRESMAAGLLRTARSGSLVLTLYPLLQPRDERRAEQHPRLAPIRRWRLRLVGGAEESGALSYGVGNRWPPACCARRDRARSSSLFIPCCSRATSAAPNNTRGWRRSADGGFPRRNARTRSRPASSIATYQAGLGALHVSGALSPPPARLGRCSPSRGTSMQPPSSD